jgi:hypothetical protein
MTCSHCHYWNAMMNAMAKLDPTWNDKPTPAHSCPGKAANN